MEILCDRSVHMVISFQMMRPSITILLGFAAALTVTAGISAGSASVKGGPPPADAARPIWDTWLRFHEAELCQGVDTVFIFHKKGMEVWCRIEDEKAFQKFSEILKPLRAKYEIGVYATHPPPADKKSGEDRYPPPSLWNNNELRIYLGDPFAREENLTPLSPSNVGPPPHSKYDTMLKQRMLMFADQTLDWARRLRRLGEGLPALAGAAFGAGVSEETRARALAICRAHALAMDKYAEKISENLNEATPRALRKAPGPPEIQKSEPAAASPLEAARRVADSAQNVARRTYLFIHPMDHTVELVDLRAPSLLESFKDLRRQVSDLLRTLGDQPRV